jgi:hypothetical protein
MKMNKPTAEKISGLMNNKHLIKYIIILFALSISTNAIAGSSSTTGEGKVAAKVIASTYQGTLSGEWSGEVMSTAINGTFSITILADRTVSGTFSGIHSGSITGTVSASGEINAKGSAGFSDCSGQIKSMDGRLSGSGVWTGYGGSGSWKGGNDQPERQEN